MTAQAGSVHIEYGRDQGSQHTGASSSTSPPSARLTPESCSEDDSDFEAPARDKGLQQAIELKRPNWSRHKYPGPPESSDAEYDVLRRGPEKLEESRGIRRPSDSTIRSFMLYTPDEERAVVRKFDRRLVLFMALLYMLSFLDRSNIGNVSERLPGSVA